jgi:methylated-DNA-protein-cysteine methyltransferase-like protein
MFAEIQRVVAKIPKGQVATYGGVAKAAGFPGASRQVAWALRHTGGRLPWHRVLGAGGKVLLPGEGGLEQRLLLRQEGVPFHGDRVDLDQCEYIFTQPRFKKTRGRAKL